MSDFIELKHDLLGFHPGNQGSALVAYTLKSSDGPYISVATKCAVGFRTNEDGESNEGWEWAPSTHLNTQQITELRDFLNGVLEGTS